MHVFGGIAFAIILLAVTLMFGGCSLQKLEDLPASPGEWKTQVQKAREARNPTPAGGE